MIQLWDKVLRFNIDKVLMKSTELPNIVANLYKFKGPSFLVNYKQLVYEYRLFQPTDVYNYIVLAAMRDYNYSKAMNILTLDADFCSLSRKDIDRNKLIWYNKGLIYFKFEEEKASTLERGIKNGD